MRHTTLATLLLVALFLFSCRKTEQKTPELAPVGTSYQEVPKQLPSYIQRIASTIKDQDAKYRFADQFERLEGLPVWDQSDIIFVPSRLHNGKSTGIDTLVLVPLVLKGQKKVNSLLACKVSGDSIFIQLYRSRRYAAYPFGKSTSGMTAESLALQFMWFDRKVFGDSVFRITDKRLFKYAASDTARLRLIRLRPGDMAVATSKMQPLTYTRCYEVVHDGDEGQLVGVEPGGTNNYYWSETVCTTYTLWFDDGTGGSTTPPDGGGGTPTPGGSPGGGGGDGDCPAVAVVTAAKSPPPPGDCGGTGWEPYPVPTDPDPDYSSYVLSDVDYDILNKISNDAAAADAVFGSPCHSTVRFGNVQFPGTLEHWMIQFDYLTTPGAALEYYIPGAGANGGAGFADIANENTKEMYEIKPDNDAGFNSGVTEIARYVNTATAACQNGTWTPGASYTGRNLPNPRDPTTVLQTRLAANGVILYKAVPKATNPLPVAIPTTIAQKLKQLVQKIGQNPNNIEPMILIFLRLNPDVTQYIKGAAYGAAAAVIIGTIAEDLMTFTTGIWNDWASFVAAYRLVQIAIAL